MIIYFPIIGKNLAFANKETLSGFAGRYPLTETISSRWSDEEKSPPLVKRGFFS